MYLSLHQSEKAGQRPPVLTWCNAAWLSRLAQPKSWLFPALAQIQSEAEAGRHGIGRLVCADQCMVAAAVAAIKSIDCSASIDLRLALSLSQYGYCRCGLGSSISSCVFIVQLSKLQLSTAS